jgi:hypothetical protein
LLVVIAIIAILAACCCQRCPRPRTGGRRAVCRSNLRQWGLALTQYARLLDSYSVMGNGSYYAQHIGTTDPGVLNRPPSFGARRVRAGNGHWAFYGAWAAVRVVPARLTHPHPTYRRSPRGSPIPRRTVRDVIKPVTGFLSQLFR